MAKTNASLKALVKDAKGKKARTPKQSEKKAAPQKTLSTEFVQESEEESEAESDSNNESLPKKPIALTSNGKAPAPDGSRSSSESDSDSDEDEEEEGSDAEESEGSEAEDSEGDEDVAEDLKLTIEVAKPPAVAASNAPTTYKPPPGFESTSIRNATQISKTFSKSQLAGKQIWYFTAPASVPISTLQDMSLLRVENGDSVLSYNDNDYGFTQGTAEERLYMAIMVPSSDSCYKAVSKPIDRVLHLGQAIKLPGTHSLGTSKATVPQEKPVRQQPKGLKMRFLPIGFGGEAGIMSSSSDSDVQMQETPKKFRKPMLTNSASFTHKDAEKTPVKSKKNVEISSDESSNSDEDEETAEAALLPLKPVVETPTKSSKSATPSKSTTNGTLKRKHGEDSKKESKKSSSQLTDTPSNKPLKRQKTKQTKSQKC